MVHDVLGIRLIPSNLDWQWRFSSLYLEGRTVPDLIESGVSGPVYLKVFNLSNVHGDGAVWSWRQLAPDQKLWTEGIVNIVGTAVCYGQRHNCPFLE